MPILPTHPEARAGEICITNTTKEDYPKIGWKTKRMGKIARRIIKAHPCNRYGLEPIPELFPVFVQESEYNEGMK